MHNAHNGSEGFTGHKKLAEENIFVMDTARAETQDIRPLQILIVNLMPTKEVTETQILRALSNTPLQLDITLLHMASHKAAHTSEHHLSSFYRTFDEIKERYFDGMIITGAPIELMPFEEVNYWQELTAIMDWREDHVYSTLYICWGAQAGLYYHSELTKNCCRRSYSGFLKTRSLIKGRCCFAVWMKFSTCPIQGTRRYRLMRSKPIRN